MARPVSLPELRQRVLQHADALNSTFFSTAELNEYINGSITELYDLLVASRYYYNTFNITTSANTSTYALPFDFYKPVQVDLQIDSTHWATVGEFVNEERNIYNYVPMTWTKNLFMGGSNALYRINGTNIEFIPTPSTGGDTIRLGYIPACPFLCDTLPSTGWANGTAKSFGDLITVSISSVTYVEKCVIAGTTGSMAPLWVASNGTLNDNGVVWSFMGPLTQYASYFDSVNGWDEFVVVDAAIKALQRQELDTSTLMAQRAILKERVEEMAHPRDANRPSRIQDVNRTTGWPYGFSGPHW